MRWYMMLPVGYIILHLLYKDKMSFEFLNHNAYHDQQGVECVDRTLDDQESLKYLIHTPTCVIPNISVDHPSVAKFKLKTPMKVVCGNTDPLTEAEGMKVRFHPERLKQYNVNSSNSLNCSFQGIVRKTQDPNHYDNNCDRGWVLKPSVPLTDSLTSIGEEDAVLVTCYRRNTSKKKKVKKKDIVYQNVHYFIQPKRYKEKMKLHQQFLKAKVRGDLPRKLNVLLVGNDAVSRGNLIRHMPRTYEYLTKSLGAIDFRGFNKIGDNTFPNLVAITTGMSANMLQNHTCYPDKNHKLDSCPFIWKRYAQKGYVTYYLEDAPWMGTFRYARTGFVEEPTDIYNSPYAFVSDKFIGHNANLSGLVGKACQGSELTSEILYNYTMKIVETLKDVPHFGITWIASLTHDKLEFASAADEPALDFFQRLHHGGYLENTAVFFLSDHGLRWGSIRSTYVGMLEERMPFLFLILPPWFKDKHPTSYKNLLINKRRLTSNFDLHVTLRDFLTSDYADPIKSSINTTTRGQSLFDEVPLNRSCSDLAIEPHFCACQTTREADVDDPHLWASANHTVHHLNQGLLNYTQCSQLMLDKVLGGRVSEPGKSTKPKKLDSSVKNYIVIFSTKPSGAHLESTVQFDNGTYTLQSEVSRINKYGNQSHCIKDFVFRKYCYCKDLL